MKIRLYPGQPGTGYVFESHIVGGASPEPGRRPAGVGMSSQLALEPDPPW